jgi:hypothetical protein
MSVYLKKPADRRDWAALYRLGQDEFLMGYLKDCRQELLEQCAEESDVKKFQGAALILKDLIHLAEHEAKIVLASQS